MIAMMSDEEFLEHLRRALNHLYEPDRLRQNPLTALFDVADRIDTFSALQKILTGAIESLEPKADEPPQSPAWEIYEPLYYRHVQQLNQQQVAKQLGMSVRHLRRKEHAALEVLAARLWEQFDLEENLRGEGPGEGSSPESEIHSPTVSEELAWLKNSPPEHPTDLNLMLPDLMHLIQPVAVQHGVNLETSITEPLPRLAVHEVALRQTLLNLLSVGINRASDGRVSITTKSSPWEVEVRVQGAKDPSAISPIAHNDASRLELAQQLADLCECEMTLHDDAGGFEAVLTLPALQQIPVLAIDDNADTLQLLRRYTVGSRYQLVTTRDPEEALSLAERISPRIIVLDVMMPQVDGWKVLAQLRQHVLTEHIPIVICTILPQEEMAFALGANGFVKKPVTRRVFLTALDQHVELMAPESH